MSVPSGTVQTVPQHGVRGTQRDEPWLSLEDDDQRTRQLIARLAYEVYDSCRVGSPAPVVEARARRMQDPQIGDLVVETSSVLFRANHYRDVRSAEMDPLIDSVCKGVGYLVLHRREWIEYDEENIIDPNDPDEPKGYHEDYWYIQYGPNPEDVCRWENCEFIAVDLGRRAWGELEFQK